MRRLAYLLLIPLVLSVICCAPVTKDTPYPETSYINRDLETYSLSLPGKNWSLVVDLPGFTLQKEAARTDGSGTMMMAENLNTDVIISITLESKPDIRSTEACKTYYWNKSAGSPIKKSEIKHVPVGVIASVEWFVQDIMGFPIMQQNINGYQYHDGVCIDIHLSKSAYEPKDKALLSAILQSVRLSDTVRKQTNRQELDSVGFSPLAAMLFTSDVQWVFRHICVPRDHLPVGEFTQGDFAEACIEVDRFYWEASLAAKNKGDQTGWTKNFAAITHSIIDLYWPKRVNRNAEGAITSFRDCEELGSLEGMLRAEKSFFGPSRKDLTQSVGPYLEQVMGKWKDDRPFDEVEAILRSGPLKMDEASAAIPLK
jgi:hypothetical protein